jgi:hypothetical protein
MYPNFGCPVFGSQLYLEEHDLFLTGITTVTCTMKLKEIFEIVKQFRAITHNIFCLYYVVLYHSCVILKDSRAFSRKDSRVTQCDPGLSSKKLY